MAPPLPALHAVLGLALEQARRDDLVVRNVAGLVAGPKVQRTEIAPLTPEEGGGLFAQAATGRLSPLWLLVTALGLRRRRRGTGAAVGGRHLDRGHLRVRASLQASPPLTGWTTCCARSTPAPGLDHHRECICGCTRRERGAARTGTTPLTCAYRVRSAGFEPATS